MSAEDALYNRTFKPVKEANISMPTLIGRSNSMGGHLVTGGQYRLPPQQVDALKFVRCPCSMQQPSPHLGEKPNLRLGREFALVGLPRMQMKVCSCPFSDPVGGYKQ